MAPSPPPRRRAALYLRISRDRTGAGLGVERQRLDCEQLAERMGLTVVGDPYVDNDLSAYSGKPRPEYRRLLADIEAGKVDVVLVWHTDRLHRSPVELEEWITKCEPRGVAVHTVQAGELDLATPSGRMVARQLGAVARYESEHRAARVAAKRNEIAKAGGFLGGIRPFGYTKNGLHIEPAEAALIAEGTRMILGGGSLRSVVEIFNASGLTTTKKGKAWTPLAVRDVLTRARNAGKLEHRGAVVGDARWPAVVTESEWRGVCAVLNNATRRTSPGNQPRWLGSMIYRCGVCGGPLVVGTSGAHRNPSYTCRSYRERGGGRHVTRAAPTLDEFAGDLVITRLSEPDAAEVFTRSRLPRSDRDMLQNELAAIEAQRIELGTRLGRGEITLGMLDAANAELGTRQRELEAALAEAATTSPVAALIEADDVEATWKTLPLDTQRAIVAEVLEVTVLPAPRGRRPDGKYFDTSSIKIEWKGRNPNE